MKKYRVGVLESWTFFIDIEAESEEKAEQKGLELLTKEHLLQLTDYSKYLLQTQEFDMWEPAEFEYCEANEIKGN